MPNTVEQVRVVTQAAINKNQNVTEMALFDATTGAPFGTLPKQTAAQTDMAAMTSTAAITGGEPPTEAEFNQLRADVVALRTVVNGLLGKMRTSGALAP